MSKIADYFIKIVKIYTKNKNYLQKFIKKNIYNFYQTKSQKKIFVLKKVLKK